MKKKIHVKSTPVIVVSVLLSFVTLLNADIPWLHVDGNKIKDPEGNIVVLRGISLIDLGFLEGWQGGAINMIDRITNKGDSQGNSPGWYPKVLRIPIHPPDSVDNWPYRWDPSNDRFYKGLLRPIVDYCAEKDLYVIIDWHYITDTWDKVEQTSEFWRYMAPRFANDSHVLFELFNEPINHVGSDTDNWLSVRTDMQTWVDIIRSYAPYNLILVSGPSWSQSIGPAARYPIAGCNIAMVAHVYPAHWRNPTRYKNHITTCATAYPIMMTEWGFSQSNHPDPDDLLHGTITDYGRPLMEFIEDLSIGSTAWVASYNWGPPMFWEDWTLRCGEGEMGGFVKDWLYEKRNDDQPHGAVQPPNDWGCHTTEDFEANNFRKFPWEQRGDENWIISRQERHSGTCSAQSGSIDHDESSVLRVTLECISGDITFYRKVSSESGYDGLMFVIDGVEKGNWSGEEDWLQVSFPVENSSHLFEWIYSKDGSVSEGSDAAWIDDLVFPLDIHIQPPDEPEPLTPETDEFDLYVDDVASGILASSGQEGFLDYDCQDYPADGNFCIHWTGVDQYSTISFHFVLIKDLSTRVDRGFAVELWTRCDRSNTKFDVRFVDTKTSDPDDHPWRMRYTIDRNVAEWNGEWNHLQIPLNNFTEHGSWDNGRWYGPIGAFDWSATDCFEIVAEYYDLKGIHLYFDSVRVIDPRQSHHPQSDIR